MSKRTTPNVSDTLDQLDRFALEPSALNTTVQR